VGTSLQGGVPRYFCRHWAFFSRFLVGFIAVDVWNNFDKAKAAVATEASALRAVVLLAGTFPEEQKARFYALTSKRSGLCQSVGSLRSLAALINVANGHPRSKGTEVFAPDHAIL
jgi:hypothetical protein